MSCSVLLFFEVGPQTIRNENLPPHKRSLSHLS